MENKYVVYPHGVDGRLYLFESKKEARHFFESIKQTQEDVFSNTRWVLAKLTAVPHGYDLEELEQFVAERGY